MGYDNHILHNKINRILLILNYINQKYCEPHRYYHNLNHIARMFEIAKENNITLSNEQQLAIWFHDIEYNINKDGKSNEEKSALFVKSLNDILCDNNMNMNIIQTIIRDTEKEIPTIEESKVVIDLDLWDLGTYRYWENGELIKKEFLTVMSEEDYISGRIKWIESFLKRDSIFVSDYTTKEHEEKAKENLTNDITILTVNNFLKDHNK